MASNRFGNLFTISTWGESHGPAIGVVIDGCPAGLAIDEACINHALKLRAPGRNAYTSPRKEPDHAEILSGIFEGVTTGAPISILIRNRDANSAAYEPIKKILRPGHANYSYESKYGVFDWRGGGRASARETACRVAAAAIAEQLLRAEGIEVLAYVKQVGDIIAKVDVPAPKELQAVAVESPVFCPDPKAAERIIEEVEAARDAGDSLGGLIEFQALGLPVGLGDPVYEKLEARLAYGMMSIPATKGFEIGSGFHAVKMRGSEHNDLFVADEGAVHTSSNNAGGTLGGISSGEPLVGRVAFKPTASIAKSQASVDLEGKEAELKLPEGSRHDPCVALRAAPIVRAMALLVIADALLLNRSARA